MSIQSIGSAPVYQPLEAEQVRQAQSAVPAPQAREGRAPAFDRYEPAESPVRESAGVYEIVPDEEGKPSIRFDNPEEPAAPRSRAEQTTTNTDRVDRELEQLRKKLEELQNRLRTAAPEQREALERQAGQVRRELEQKDNDTYRRQHAVVS